MVNLIFCFFLLFSINKKAYVVTAYENSPHKLKIDLKRLEDEKRFTDVFICGCPECFESRRIFLNDTLYLSSFISSDSIERINIKELEFIYCFKQKDL